MQPHTFSSENAHAATCLVVIGITLPLSPVQHVSVARFLPTLIDINAYRWNPKSCASFDACASFDSISSGINR